MKSFRTPLAAAVGAVSLVMIGASAVAYAQDAAQPGAPAARSFKDGQHRHMRHHGQRAQLVHDALNLRPQQEDAWRAYRAELDAARPARGARPAGAERPRDLTTPERLDRMQQRMAMRQDVFARRAAATKRFYAALDPAQQRTFDAVSQLGGGRDGHHRGRGGMGRMHGQGWSQAPAQG